VVVIQEKLEAAAAGVYPFHRLPSDDWPLSRSLCFVYKAVTWIGLDFKLRLCHIELCARAGCCCGVSQIIEASNAVNTHTYIHPSIAQDDLNQSSRS